MTRREVVVLIDDTDGGDATETIKFAMDGWNYEIDLSGPNAKAMREKLDLYMSHGRRQGRHGATPASVPPRRGGPTHNDKDQNKAIRAWAARKGQPVSDRGRIPQNIVEAYNSDAGRDTPANGHDGGAYTPGGGSPFSGEPWSRATG